MGDARAPIGIFDSGVGGLTVFRALERRLPSESLIYLGDTARVPYGTKSAETVRRYAWNCTNLLRERGVKYLVFACNTASAYAVDSLREEFSIPLTGVVEPGARAAAEQSRNGRIGVIGTAGTVASGAYQRAIAQEAADAAVFTAACPLFVPLAEEGWTEGPVPEMTARHYLESLLGHDIDTLVLGCTHYPLLETTIAAVAGPSVTLIDSANATAEVVAEALAAGNLSAPQDNQASKHFLATDAPDGLARIGKLFLGYAPENVEWVDV